VKLIELYEKLKGMPTEELRRALIEAHEEKFRKSQEAESRIHMMQEKYAEVLRQKEEQYRAMVQAIQQQQQAANQWGQIGGGCFGVASDGVYSVEHGAAPADTRLDAIESRLAGIEQELQVQRHIITQLHDWMVMNLDGPEAEPEPDE
jgi:DNA repair exonuclease SbcCD ATPase subunit